MSAVVDLFDQGRYAEAIAAIPDDAAPLLSVQMLLGRARLALGQYGAGLEALAQY
jgi:hypothetical protein